MRSQAAGLRSGVAPVRASKTILVLVAATCAATAASAGAVEGFDSCQVAKPLNGQGGWIVDAADGMRVTAPADGNSTKAAVEVSGQGNSTNKQGPRVGEKADQHAGVPDGSPVQYSAWLRPALVTGGKAAAEVYVAARVVRGKDQPMVAGGDANVAGLGPRFGFARGAQPRFAIIPAGQTAAKALTSKLAVRPGRWYELRLLIKPDSKDIRRSTGSLFYRDVAGGAKAFAAVADLRDVPLNLTAAVRPAKFGAWVIVGAGGQVDNISASKADAALVNWKPPAAADKEKAELKRQLLAQGERLKAAKAAGVAAMKRVSQLQAKLTALEKRLKAADAATAKWKDAAVKSGKGQAEQKKKLALLAKQLKTAEAELKKAQAAHKAAKAEVASWRIRAAAAEKKLAAIEAAKKKIPPWRHKANWRKLAIGQTPKQVKAILGEPGKIFTGTIGDKPRIVWYYPAVFGGNVEFDGGKVRAWKEP